MKLRVFTAGLVALIPLLAVSALPASSVARAAQPAARSINGQMHGTFKGSHGNLKSSGTFSGNFTAQHFVAQGKRIMVQGVLNGTFKDASGNTEKISHPVTLPVESINSSSSSAASSLQAVQPAGLASSRSLQGSCSILYLHTGQITLNLLGLVLNVAPITITLTGQTGPGNLLGNLLCGIAGLLNNTNLANLNQVLIGDIVMLLNQLLSGL